MPKKFDSIEEKREYERQLYHSSKGSYKEKTLARKKKSQQISSQFIWDYLKKHPCIDCGETDPIVLEFDHLGDKIRSITDMSSRGAGLELIKLEIEKCEVRCANCHRRKTAIQLVWYKDITK